MHFTATIIRWVLLDADKIDVLPKRKITSRDITITKEDYAIMTSRDQVPKLTLKVRAHN
jgi:hypothetical protein